MEYHLSTPYDLETMELYLDGGILLNNGNNNPDAIFFGANGYKDFFAKSSCQHLEKLSNIPFHHLTILLHLLLDGEANINDLVPSATLVQVRGSCI